MMVLTCIPIKISLEIIQCLVFKTNILVGLHVDYEINKDFF